MLQCLERADRHPELHPVLRVLDGLVVHRLHDTDGLGAYRERRFPDDLGQDPQAFTGNADHGIRARRHVVQPEFGGLARVDRRVRASAKPRGVRGQRE